MRNADVLPKKLSRLRVTVDRQRNGVGVTLPAPWYGKSRYRTNLIFVSVLFTPVMLLWIVVLLGALLRFQGINALLFTLAFSPFLMAGSTALAACLIPVSRTCHIIFSEGVLTIQVRGWFINRSWKWSPGEVWAIGQVRGLWIVDVKGRHEFLRERCDEELVWLASWLRAELGVTNTPPPGSGELPVMIGVRFLEAEPGLLTVKPGEMTIRHAFSPLRDLWVRPRIFPRLVWLRSFLPKTKVWVFPQDLVCFKTPDGGWCLHVLLANDKPGLTLQSSDPEGMPRAVARFWGGTDE